MQKHSYGYEEVWRALVGMVQWIGAKDLDLVRSLGLLYNPRHYYLKEYVSIVQTNLCPCDFHRKEFHHSSLY